jgi:hypothetical protein
VDAICYSLPVLKNDWSLVSALEYCRPKLSIIKSSTIAAIDLRCANAALRRISLLAGRTRTMRGVTWILGLIVCFMLASILQNAIIGLGKVLRNPAFIGVVYCYHFAIMQSKQPTY